MRQAIETAPRDGTIVVLEEDSRGTYDVAHWSAEAGRWVGENGEPSKIIPTHWHQRHGDYQYFLQEDERQHFEDERQPRRFAAFPIVAAIFLVMGFMCLYFEVLNSLYLEVFHSETSLPNRPRIRPTWGLGIGPRPIMSNSRKERRSSTPWKRPLGNRDSL